MPTLSIRRAILLSLLVLHATLPWGAFTSSASADGQSDWEVVLDLEQNPVRVAALGAAYQDDYLRLSLSAKPVALQTVTGTGPAGESMGFHAAFVSHELISDGADELTAQQISDLSAVYARAFLVVGTLSGPSGSADCLGLYYSTTDENSQVYHHFLPVAEVSETLISTLAEASYVVQSSGGGAGSDPCDSITHCYDIYRQRKAAALREFTDCIKDQAPPISLCAVGCFILCAPFVAGTPAAYLACVAVCLAGCSGITVLEVDTCSDELEAKVEAAKNSYCSCISWKQQNCQTPETDLVGCGP